MNQQGKSTAIETSGPWWKFGHMWMVVGGPVVVVIASFITLYFAVTRPDPVLDKAYYEERVELNKTMGGTLSSASPAMQARNHAATGVPVPAVEKSE